MVGRGAFSVGFRRSVVDALELHPLWSEGVADGGGEPQPFGRGGTGRQRLLELLLAR